MLERLGNVIYYAACLSGILFFIFASGLNAGEIHDLKFSIVASLTIWIVGWAIRYILSGNKSFRL